MNIVDIITISRKFTNDNDDRHITYNNNITYFINISHNYINPENKHILNNYKRFLNQLNMKTIIQCIKSNIIIVPILYRLSNHDIIILINNSIEHNNIDFLNILSDCIYFDNTFFRKTHIILLDIIKLIHKKVGLTKEDYQTKYSYVYYTACEYGRVNVIKYLHKEIKLTKEDFQSQNNYVCRLACNHGQINIIKYLHQKIGFEKHNFEPNISNNSCILACQNGNINVVKYLHEYIGLTKADFQFSNNDACMIACQDGHIDVVKYLHKVIGLTKRDFQSQNNSPCRLACIHGHIDVINYLYEEFGLVYKDHNNSCQIT